jgi:phytoene/squalene synthetase
MLRDLSTSRDAPDLERLERIEQPEAFVWAILPHAARTFSACIAMLPARSALPAAVAYLYCRMLDTYEDLLPDPATRDASLRQFAGRFEGSGARLSPAPEIAHAADRDARDRAHLLLVRRAGLVDRVYESLNPELRGIVRDLVRDMAEGMIWSSATFAAQGGVLDGEAQLEAYCGHVLGNPAVFGVRLLRMEHGASSRLSNAERAHAMDVGVLVQLANVTRDIEKDLRRGVAYDASLRPFLGRDPVLDEALAARCREVRVRLMRVALERAPAYARIIEMMHLPRWSVGRGSGLLMLLFTERYYHGTARRLGLPVWPAPPTFAAMLWRTFRATLSADFAFREIARVERAFLELAAAIPAFQRGSRPPRTSATAS